MATDIPASAAEDEADRAIHRLLRSFRSRDSYGVVLLMIIATYGLSIWLTQPWGAPIVVFVQIGTVWLTLLTSHAHHRLRVAATVLVTLAALTAIVSLIAHRTDEPLPFVYLAGSVLYFAAPFTIVRHVAFRRDVDRETMLGALSAYLLFGIAFALAYSFLAGIQDSTPFFGPAGPGDIADHLFFSFVTLTTTGYGNLVPAGNPGQTMAVMEALIGQLFLVTAVAKLVSAWRPRWPVAGGGETGGRAA